MSKEQNTTRETIISVVSGIILGVACGIGILIAILGLHIVWSFVIVLASLALVFLLVWIDVTIHKN